MFWPKRDVWKLIISITGLLFFLVSMVWIPATLVGAHGKMSGLAPTATVQTSPTVDVTATMNALQEDKLRQEIQQLQNQNEQYKNQNTPDFFIWLPGWFRTNAAILLSTLVVVIGGLIGFFRWFGDRRSEREKRAEERFQVVVAGLGSKDREAQVGSAIMLRTFLQPHYKQFYNQVFDLAVAYLRLRHIDPANAEPLDSLSQALITVFKESFLKIRPRLRWIGRKWPKSTSDAEQQLNAANIQLDTAFLYRADLRYAWMFQAYLRKANLIYADFRQAYLREADLSGADLSYADLSGANLWGANLNGAKLYKTKLIHANLRQAKLINADLLEADLSVVSLSKADLSGADLRHTQFRSEATYFEDHSILPIDTVIWDQFYGTILYHADLSGADLRGADLWGVRNLEEIRSLEKTDLRGVKGLTKEQLEACKAMGAIIDEDSTTSLTEPPTSPSPQSQQ